MTDPVCEFSEGSQETAPVLIGVLKSAPEYMENEKEMEEGEIHSRRNTRRGNQMDKLEMDLVH